jgi:hypothetical protein
VTKYLRVLEVSLYGPIALGSTSWRNTQHRRPFDLPAADQKAKREGKILGSQYTLQGKTPMTFLPLHPTT